MKLLRRAWPIAASGSSRQCACSPGALAPLVSRWGEFTGYTTTALALVKGLGRAPASWTAPVRWRYVALDPRRPGQTAAEQPCLCPHFREQVRPIPKGLCPPAQGCEARATLGRRMEAAST